MARAHKPKLAVWKFSSCDGCQLMLLDCEDELLALTEHVRVSYFLEATRKVERGPYDISLVEGSITTPHDVARIREVRQQSKVLITLGACATAGGIQALRNFAKVRDYIRAVYAHPEFIDNLATSSAISDHVPVDFELRGCPISKHQLIEVLSAYLNHRKPVVPRHSQCMECKANGVVCRMVAAGQACLGPVTQAGCGTLCPGIDRGCYGCFGPTETPNTAALAAKLAELGKSPAEIHRLFRSFNTNAEAFRKEAERHG